MLISFETWRSFDQAYRYDPEAGRYSMFKPLAKELEEPCAGLYLIADDRLGSLSEPTSVVYLGCSVGSRRLSTFHERLKKHCCKAVGHCGGRFTGLDGEPRDTVNWARYRSERFRGFDSWHFSWATVAGSDFDATRSMVKAAERVALHEYEQQTGALPVCNYEMTGRGPGPFRIAFPWGREPVGHG